MALVRSRPVLHHPFAPWLAPPDQVARTLVGREDALRNVIEKIDAIGKGGGAKHVLIIGPRGMGKTHLVCFIHHYVSQRIEARSDLPGLPKNCISVLFVEEEYAAHDTLANFLLALCSKLREADLGEEAWRLPKGLREKPDRAVIDCCLERIQTVSGKRQKKLLILVDNIQKVLQQFPAEDHHRLRAFLMDQTALLLVGTAPWLFKEVVDYRAPFFEFFETLYLTDLTEKEMLRLLAARFHEDGLEAEFRKREENLTRKIPAIRKLTGGNPRLILFLYQIVTRSAFLEVESALRELIEELSDYFRSRYDALADQPRKVLDTLAQMEGPSTPTEIARAARLSVQKVNAQLKRLKGWAYVEPVKHERRRATHYDVTERLFRIWRQTATVAGRQRFKFLAQFLKIYYTPEEMVEIVRSYRKELLTREVAVPREDYRHAVDDLYYFQEAASGALCREIFDLRMEVFISLEDYTQAEQEAEHFLAGSVKAEDQASAAAAYKIQAEVHAASGRHKEALKDVKQLLRLDHYEEAITAAEAVLRKAPSLAEAWALRGQAAIGLDNHTLALESFHKATDLEPGEARYWGLQALALRRLARAAEALACAERASELNPNDPRIWGERGQAAEDLGDYMKALESFQKAAALDPNDAFYWHFQTLALGNLERYAEALACAERAIELQPDDAHLWEWRGIAATDLGDHAKALESFQKATALESKEARYWRLQAHALREVGRHTEALTCAERAVELKPDDPWTWVERGWAAVELDDRTKALESFQKATALQPEEAHYLHFQAMALRNHGRHAEALASAERAVELQPDKAHFWEWRGIAATDLGDHAKALESFQKATALEPDEAHHWELQAEAFGRLGRHAEALASAERAVELQPDKTRAWEGRGRAAAALGDHAKALESFQKASALEPKEGHFWHKQAEVLEDLGRYSEALACVDSAIELRPEAGNLFVQRAWTLNALGGTKEALEALVKALDRNALERDVFHARGDILLLSGRFEEAREALERGLVVAPDDWDLLVDREITCACLREHGSNMGGLAAAILAVKVPRSAPAFIVRFLFDVAARCTTRGDLDRARHLLDVAFSMPWQHEEWFGKTLGIFIGKLLDGAPLAFEMVIDKAKEKIIEPNILALLDPYLQTAAYIRTGDVSILDRLFPEVRELVLEISQRLRRRASSSGSQ